MLTWSAFLLAPVAASIVLAGRNPYVVEVFAPCGFREATGLLCPGCGATRAAYSALSGNFAESLAMNPLVLLGYPAAAIAAAGLLMNDPSRSRLSAALTWIGLGTILAIMAWGAIGRNIVGVLG